MNSIATTVATALGLAEDRVREPRSSEVTVEVLAADLPALADTVVADAAVDADPCAEAGAEVAAPLVLSPPLSPHAAATNSTVNATAHFDIFFICQSPRTVRDFPNSDLKLGTLPRPLGRF